MGLVLRWSQFGVHLGFVKGCFKVRVLSNVGYFRVALGYTVT